jgi:hypothetical protein
VIADNHWEIAVRPVDQTVLGHLGRLEVVLEQHLRKVAVHLVRLVLSRVIVAHSVKV